MSVRVSMTSPPWPSPTISKLVSIWRMKQIDLIQNHRLFFHPLRPLLGIILICTLKEFKRGSTKRFGLHISIIMICLQVAVVRYSQKLWKFWLCASSLKFVSYNAIIQLTILCIDIGNVGLLLYKIIGTYQLNKLG